MCSKLKVHLAIELIDLYIFERVSENFYYAWLNDFKVYMSVKCANWMKQKMDLGNVMKLIDITYKYQKYWSPD